VKYQHQCHVTYDSMQRRQTCN